jgi:RHS repeat-associated protein
MKQQGADKRKPRKRIAAQTYKFAYQGIQKDATTGWSMFELRSFDTRTARWSAPDPYMQHYSPYLAMGNNPVSMIDPNGGLDFYFDWGTGLSAMATGMQALGKHISTQYGWTRIYEN